MCDAANRRLQVLQDAESAVLRLVSACQSSTAGSRVGHAIRGALCVDECYVWEAGEAKFLDANLTFERTEVSLGSVDLVHAHTVADEIEHILGSAFSKSSQSNQQDAQCRKDSFLHVCCYFKLYNYPIRPQSYEKAREIQKKNEFFFAFEWHESSGQTWFVVKNPLQYFVS